MNKLYMKYKSIVAYLILSGYFFLIGYNISHYHKYDFNFNINHQLDEVDNNKAVNKHLIYLDFQCPVHSTYSSVHNSLLSSQDFYSSPVKEVEPLKFYSQQFYFKNQFFPSILLRAPPVFSWFLKKIALINSIILFSRIRIL